MAGELGIEPRIAESKSVVIPLHYSPSILYHIKTHCEGFFGQPLHAFVYAMCFYMVGRIGFEPMTNRLKVYCSAN